MIVEQIEPWLCCLGGKSLHRAEKRPLIPHGYSTVWVSMRNHAFQYASQSRVAFDLADCGDSSGQYETSLQCFPKCKMQQVCVSFHE